MSVLEEVQTRFNEQLQQAYRFAQQELNEKIVGEEVELTYPYQSGKESGPREESVTGTVERVEVGEMEDVDFTTYITFEDGRRYLDAEGITVL